MEKESFVRHFLNQIKHLFSHITTDYQEIEVPLSGEVIDRVAHLKLLMEDYEEILTDQLRKEGANAQLALKSSEKPDYVSDADWEVIQEARELRDNVRKFQQRVAFTVQASRKEGKPGDKKDQARARKRRFGKLRGRKDWNPL